MLQIVPHSSDTCFSQAEQCLLKILCSLEHPTVGEVTVFFGGKGVLRTLHTQEAKMLLMKICKLCNTRGYTYGMGMYSGKNRTHLT